MRTRTIISLEKRQLTALKARARAKGLSLAEFVRSLVTEYLESDRPPTPVPPSSFARLVALGSSGRGDISDRHDALLADALRQQHDG